MSVFFGQYFLELFSKKVAYCGIAQRVKSGCQSTLEKDQTKPHSWFHNINSTYFSNNFHNYVTKNIIS